ncbi:MAG: hypothetical protein AAGA35_03150 [Patescibacteria group bacterium]
MSMWKFVLGGLLLPGIAGCTANTVESLPEPIHEYYVIEGWDSLPEGSAAQISDCKPVSRGVTFVSETGHPVFEYLIEWVEIKDPESPRLVEGEKLVKFEDDWVFVTDVEGSFGVNCKRNF